MNQNQTNDDVSWKARRQLSNELLSKAAEAHGILEEVTGGGEHSRRSILNAAAFAGVSYLVSGNVWRKMFTTPEKDAESEGHRREVQGQTAEEEPSQNEKPSDPEKERQERTILQAACQIGWDGFLLKVGQVTLMMACNSLGIKVGNARTLSLVSPQAHDIEKMVLELEKKGPQAAIEVFTEICMKAPLREELICRVIPSLLLRDNGRHWEIGLPSAVLFALIHNITDPTKCKNAISFSETRGFSLDWVPLPQFMAGVFYWYLAREYGVVAPVVMHMLANYLPAAKVSNGLFGAHQRLNKLKEEIAAEDRAKDSAGLDGAAMPPNFRSSES